MAFVFGMGKDTRDGMGAGMKGCMGLVETSIEDSRMGYLGCKLKFLIRRGSIFLKKNYILFRVAA
jgi:hypothetical protein